MFRKFLIGFLIMAVLLLSCGGISFSGKIAYDIYSAKKTESNIQPGNHEPFFTIIPTATSTGYVCDPSTVAFEDLGELNPTIETVITGPAIYEWWTGGSNEGVQMVNEGETVTIHGALGHWWKIATQAELNCVWTLHVSNYAAKPQHAGKTIVQLVIAPPAELLTSETATPVGTAMP